MRFLVKCRRCEMPLTVDEDVLSPDMVLVPAVVVLSVAVLQLGQRRKRRRRRGRQQLGRRRRRAQRLNRLVLVLHRFESRRSGRARSVITHRGGRGERGVQARRRAARDCRAAGPRATAPRRAPPPLPHSARPILPSTQHSVFNCGDIIAAMRDHSRRRCR